MYQKESNYKYENILLKLNWSNSWIEYENSDRTSRLMKLNTIITITSPPFDSKK